MIERIKQYSIIVFFAVRMRIRSLLNRSGSIKIGFLVEEYFHEKFRGFGGYGMTIKYIAEYFSRKPEAGLTASVVLVHPLDIPKPECNTFNQVDVLMMPKNLVDKKENFYQYCSLIHQHHFNVLIGVDHFKSYEFQLKTFPMVPWVIWLKDPRNMQKWRKMASVSIHNTYNGVKDFSVYTKYCQNRFESFRRMHKLSQLFRRKIIFATESNDFIKIGMNLFGLSKLNAAFLSKPIPLPVMSGPEYSEKPSFLFLARLDPIKRPWVYCEIAKRFPQADFYVAGLANKPEIMDSVLAPYKSISNIKFLGRVLGVEKDALFRKIWAVINTSVHEGLPVSIVEGYSYGKTAIASENPDGITEKYGYCVGEMSGDGYDEKTIDLYAQHVETIINGRFDRNKIFEENRNYIRTVHSFEKFHETIKEIVLTNTYDRGFTIDTKCNVYQETT